MSLFKQNDFFSQSEIFLTKLDFLKGDTNLKKKKIFTEKNIFFPENHTYFLLKNIIIFRIVLLHLNNHTFVLPQNLQQPKPVCTDLTLQVTRTLKLFGLAEIIYRIISTSARPVTSKLGRMVD